MTGPGSAPSDEPARAGRRAARIAATSDARRRRTERAMHDGVQQHLTLLGLKLSLLRAQIREDPAAAEALCDELGQGVQASLREMRDLAHFIYPAALQNAGLHAALQVLADRSGLRVTLEVPAGERWPDHLEAAIYFCCLEVMQNVQRHAGPAAHATVRIARDDGVLGFEIADDGAGFDLTAAARGDGLQHVLDRVEALGGHVAIASSPGAGTRVRGSIPLPGA